MPGPIMIIGVAKLFGNRNVDALIKILHELLPPHSFLTNPEHSPKNCFPDERVYSVMLTVICTFFGKQDEEEEIV